MKRTTLFIWVLCAMCLSSCALLPEEETFQAAPRIKSYEAQSYKLAYVLRDDMTLIQRVSCTYMPVQSEKLSFQVGGEYIDEIFVSVGETVEVGQVLGQLRLSGVEEQIESYEEQLTRIDLQLRQLDENQALAEKKARIQQRDNPQALEEALLALEKSFAAQRQSLEDARMTAVNWLKEYRQHKAQRQLVAGLAGSVTYVRGFTEGAKSALGERVITISDTSLSIFRAETQYWSLFTPGEHRVITVSKQDYDAVVASEEELGLPPQEKVEGQKAYVYFKLTEPAVDLEDSDRGTLELILDTREQVLQLPQDSVSLMGEKSVVYYLDEEGIRRYREVETGLAANGMIEIVSGLNDGDSVIAE